MTPPPNPLIAGASKVPTLEENFLETPGAPAPAAPPITEREQQIAAARAAHPMQGIPAVKPRLSFILSGGKAPIAQENQTALHPDHKPHEHSDAKTVHE